MLHIGIKLVLATTMNRLEYNNYRGWDLPDDENGSDRGYLVEYVDGGESNHSEHKGYISWSPEAVFDSANKPSGQMTFGMAIEAAKRGHKVARSGWNGAGMFAYIVPANSYPAQTEAVKGIFLMIWFHIVSIGHLKLHRMMLQLGHRLVQIVWPRTGA